ncbi:MAG: phosphotransferase [Thermodesulfobacteriota bacterium]
MKASDPDVQERLRVMQQAGIPPERIVPLIGDASTRLYFRAFYPSGQTAIIMVMPQAGVGEEDSFLQIRKFLADRDLPVPRLHEHDRGLGIVVLEDLGDDLLESVVARSSEDEIRALYTQAIELLVKLRKATDGLTGGCPAFERAFDLTKLMEEMDFFVTHFVRGLCRIEPSPAALATLYDFFTNICSLLAEEPRVFAHRDYHSRNLILHEGRLVMIDFQDARMGPAQYDLASLLRDSYVTVPQELMDKLMAEYFAAIPALGQDPSFERFRFVFDVMSLQRNIKALGTFGYQASVIGNRRYLSAVPRTGAYVARSIGLHSAYAPYVSVVHDLVSGPAQSCPDTGHVGF